MDKPPEWNRVKSLMRRGSTTEKDLVFRKAIVDDLPFACRITLENLQPFIDRHLGGWDEEKFREGFQPGGDDIAELGKDRVGYYSTEVRGDYLFVGNLQVAQSFQRRGIGKVLMRRIERDARRLGLKGVELHVFSDNPARRFYRKLGYAVVEKSGFLISMRKNFS